MKFQSKEEILQFINSLYGRRDRHLLVSEFEAGVIYDLFDFIWGELKKGVREFGLTSTAKVLFEDFESLGEVRKHIVFDRILWFASGAMPLLTFQIWTDDYPNLSDEIPLGEAMKAVFTMMGEEKDSWKFDNGRVIKYEDVHLNMIPTEMTLKILDMETVND